MGRLTKSKIDEISKLRKQGYTQKETAEKANVHLRTVRKYDPLKEQRPRPTVERVREIEESCNRLAELGLAHKESGGRFRISSLGKRACERFEELEKRAILQFMVEAGRPVSETEVEGYLDRISDQLFAQALDEVR